MVAVTCCPYGMLGFDIVEAQGTVRHETGFVCDRDNSFRRHATQVMLRVESIRDRGHWKSHAQDLNVGVTIHGTCCEFCCIVEKNMCRNI